MKTVLPVVLVAAALGAALVSSRGRSRESLIPLSRTVAEHEKALDRSSAVFFPLSPDEERRIGEGLDAHLASPAAAPGTPEASRAALWREMGLTAASSPLVSRFRGRYEFKVSAGGVNAFALPGGFVHTSDALLRKFGGDADAILFVAAHEIGHIELGHCADAYRLRSGQDNPVSAVLAGVSSVGRAFAELHFAPSQELEADAYAVRVLKSLKRDPNAGLRAFDALGLTADSKTKRDPGSVAVEGLTDYFHTHPGAWERRAALEREAARAAK